MSDPEFELYMYSLNQEFPVGGGHETYLARRHKGELYGGTEVEIMQLESTTIRDGISLSTDRQWSVQWLSNQWLENHTKAIGIGTRPDYDPIVTSIMRDEEFGAVVFDPRSDRVYRLNDSGTLLFESIKKSYDKNNGSIDLDKLEKDGFDREVVEKFFSKMRDAGFWLDD